MHFAHCMLLSPLLYTVWISGDEIAISGLQNIKFDHNEKQQNQSKNAFSLEKNKKPMVRMDQQ